MESVMEDLADDMRGKAVIGKVYDSERELFRAFRVRGIPTFFVIRYGEVKQSFRGTTPARTLMKALNEHPR